MSDVTTYGIVAQSAESTVVAEYVPDAKTESTYQSEAELEREFIRLLQSQAYEYLPITSEDQLIANLRTQLEALNNVTFSDTEWQQFRGCRVKDLCEMDVHQGIGNSNAIRSEEV